MKNRKYFQFAKTNNNYISNIKIFCLLVFIAFSYTLSAQETTWNGSQNSDWGNASNWSNGIPGANDFAIIRSSNNDPIIENDGIITLSHLRLEGGTLTIAKNQIVNIKRFDDYLPSDFSSIPGNIGIRPTATLINYGQINIEGNPSHITEYGIFNNGGTLINDIEDVIDFGDLAGEIHIVGASAIDVPIQNVGTFTNNRIITAEGHNDIGIRVVEQGTFETGSNSSIEIDGGNNGIQLEDDAIFTNGGMITIEDVNNEGIEIAGEGEFNNNNNGSINIQGGSDGVELVGDASFTNNGTITVEDVNVNGFHLFEEGTFTNNASINIQGGDDGVRVDDNFTFTNRGILNVDGAIDIGITISGEFINDIDGEININQRFEETTSVGIVTYNSGVFENRRGTIRIGGLKRRETDDITRAIQAGDNASFTNSQGGLIYIDAIPTNISDIIALFGDANFFNDRCSGIINLSEYEMRIEPSSNATIKNNGFIISYANETNFMTNNSIGTIINFGAGDFNIEFAPDIPGNNDPAVIEDVFCYGTETIGFSPYLGTPVLDFCYDLTFTRVDNGQSNTTGIFDGLEAGQSYDFEISWNGEVVDTYTHIVAGGAVDETPPTLNCISETLVYDLENDLSPTVTLDDLTTADPVDADCAVATFEIQGYGSSRTFGCEDSGINTLTVVAIDQADNTSTCMVDVEITGAYPERSPMFDLDIYLDEIGVATLSDSDLRFLANLSTACFTNEESRANYSVPTEYQNLDCDDVGTTTFLLDSADPNFPDANQTITVIDTTPVRASVADVTVQLDENGVGTLDESDLDFTVSDNCYTDAEIEAGYSIPSEFRTLDCTQIGTFFITLDKNNNDFPQVLLQVTVESSELSFDPVQTDFCANSSFDLTSLEDQITTASGTFSYSQSIERLYIPLEQENTVSVIDLKTNTILTNIAVSERPWGVGAHPDAKKVYITHSSTFKVSVIDVQSNTVESIIDLEGIDPNDINVGFNPLGIAFNTDGSRLYVTSVSSDNVIEINTATNAVLNIIPVGNTPTNIVLSPDDSKMYVVNENDNSVSVINTNTGASISTINVQETPVDVVISADGTKVYVSNREGLGNNVTKGAISIIDISSNTVVETVFTDTQRAAEMAVHPSGNLYTQHGNSDGTLSRMEPANGNNLTYYDIESGVGNSLNGIDINEDGSRLYLTDGNDKVIIFNTLTNTDVTSIPVDNISRVNGNFYVKTTIDIAEPTSYVPSEGDVIDVAFDGGAECASTTTINFTEAYTPIELLEITTIQATDSLFSQADTIQTIGTVEVEADDTIIFEAAEAVLLQVGFHAKAGSIFTARIRACGEGSESSIEEQSIEERTEEVETQTEAVQTSHPKIATPIEVNVAPNPFSSSTNIQFHLAQASDVSLTITDMNGRVVHQQQYLDAPSGWQQHQFEASHLPDGMYFLHIRMAEQQVVKQLVLQR